MTKHWKLNELGGNYPDIAISFGAHSECVLSPWSDLYKAIALANGGQFTLLEMMSNENVHI